MDQIHHDGGTILGSSRGGFDIDRIIFFLTENNVSQLYIIGGDGTHRGANTIGEVRGKGVGECGVQFVRRRGCSGLVQSTEGGGASLRGTG